MTAQPGHKVTLKLNQQQIELIERTIARGAAPDIEGLVRRALREYAARHPRDPEK
jgi:Arc/MetJ-type ribon-helix-helix transcriptional regulator